MGKIICSKNKGYCWSISDSTYFKGYFFFDNKPNVIFRGADAISQLKSIESYSSFVTFLKEIDGQFSIIIARNGETWISVDVARSMPLYYSSDGKIISDSSEEIRKDMNIPADNVDEYHLVEMFETSCVINNNTMYEQIKELSAGQCACINESGISVLSYFIHINLSTISDRDTATKELKRLSEAALLSAVACAGDKPIVLSLSGGYDSRFIACTLKRLGINNVSCYTYGSSSSFEVQKSKKVADALGYRWICVEHTDKLVLDILSKENEGYFDMCNEHDYTIYLQNFVAVKYLHESGWFKPNSVFFTGLCHDMPTGFYVEDPSNVTDSYDIDGLTNYIYSHHFLRHIWDDDVSNHMKNEIKQEIIALNIDINDYQSFIRANDALTTGYMHSHCYLNMNAVHSYFGYEWVLPCWDKQLLMFWYSLSYDLRIGQNFYRDWLMTNLFNEFGVDDKKQIASYGNKKSQTIKRLIGSVLVHILYPLGIPLKRSVDINNWAPLEVAIFKKIKSRNIINYRRASIIVMLNIWLIETRYSPEVTKLIKKHIEKEL